MNAKNSVNILERWGKQSKERVKKCHFLVDRKDELIKKGFIIEGFLSEISLIESTLLNVIKTHIEIEKRLLEDCGIFKSNSIVKNLKKKTLGSLIKIFKEGFYDNSVSYQTEDSDRGDLIVELDRFVSLRNKVIHSLFDEDINKLEKEIHINSDKNHGLAISLHVYELSISRNFFHRVEKKK